MLISRIRSRFLNIHSHLRIASLLTALAIMIALMSGCASSGGGSLQSNSSRSDVANKILACKSTDRQIASSSQCLQDDAACYQISNGQWCTGERGSVCPAGSSPIATGAPCPAGSRCFRLSESLECKI